MFINQEIREAINYMFNYIKSNKKYFLLIEILQIDKLILKTIITQYQKLNFYIEK